MCAGVFCDSNGVRGVGQREKLKCQAFITEQDLCFNNNGSIVGRWRADIAELETSYLRTEKISSDWRISENKYNVCHEYAFAG